MDQDTGQSFSPCTIPDVKRRTTLPSPGLPAAAASHLPPECVSAHCRHPCNAAALPSTLSPSLPGDAAPLPVPDYMGLVALTRGTAPPRPVCAHQLMRNRTRTNQFQTQEKGRQTWRRKPLGRAKIRVSSGAGAVLRVLPTGLLPAQPRVPSLKLNYSFFLN